MIKMQKITAILIMAVIAISAVCALGLSINQAAAQSGTIGVSDLGLQYGAVTGLGSTDIRTTIARIIRVAMGLLGIVAVVIILIGGFTWMTAGGNEEKVGEAKKWIFAGIIGLAIILSAYALANFVINSLVNATTNTNL